ncbi:MAG TPA: GDSL-type esterase/lipase family protein [Streptosporangiaceae bacterium]|nr:GDSL-type esterase/lipase family protein [Streptosporangiaceae bacterium]
MKIVRLANYVAPASGGLRTALRQLGAGYLAAGHEPVLVIPGRQPGRRHTEQGLVITVPGPAVPGTGGYRAIVARRSLRRLLDDLGPDRLDVSDRTTLRWTGDWARARGVRSMMVSHDRLAGLVQLFAPPGLPVAWLSDRLNAGTAASFDVVVCTTGWAGAEFRRHRAAAVARRDRAQAAGPAPGRALRLAGRRGWLPARPRHKPVAAQRLRVAAGPPPYRAAAGRECPMMPACGITNHRQESSPTTRFAALGDSVTLGMGDPMPHGGWRGWAALLAESLAPPDRVELSNLARSGALVSDVADEQLPRALSLAPTLASVLVGMNDTLRGKFDLATIAADLEKTITTLQRAGALVLTASLPDPGLLLRIPESLRRPLARRAQAINSVLGQLATHYDVVHVDLAANPAIYDKRMWGVDRLHPGERGHRLLAREFAAGPAERGMPPLALPDPEPANPEPSAWAQAHWMATKGTGWLVRRSRDLVPRLLQLAVTEWWHELRGRPRGRHG